MPPKASPGRTKPGAKASARRASLRPRSTARSTAAAKKRGSSATPAAKKRGRSASGAKNAKKPRKAATPERRVARGGAGAADKEAPKKTRKSTVAAVKPSARSGKKSSSGGGGGKPLFVFAHGAGAGSSHPWMVRWAERLRTIGNVHTFDYSYIAKGGRPPLATKLVDEHAAVAADAHAEHGGPLILIGKSMGSRIGCHVAVDHGEELGVAAVICLGYPMMGMNGKLRDEVVKAMSDTACLFVQGSRDKMSPMDVMRRVVTEHNAVAGAPPFELMEVEGGDHGLGVTAKQRKLEGGLTQDDCDDRILQAIKQFVDTVA